jgi:hypothetical protein
MSLHAQQSPEAQAALAAQKRNSTISALIISLLTFGLVILVLMVIALTVNSKSPPEIISYAAGVEEAEEIEKPEMTNEVERKPSAPSSSLAKVIAANTTSPTAMPVPDIEVTELSLDFGNGDDFGEGWGNGEGWGSGGGGGSLFGTKIKSNNLGVILDVSGSAHKHLDKAITEIDESFPKSHMVLVVGCGMSDGKGAFGGGGGKVPGKPRVVAYQDMDSEKEYNHLARSAPAQLENFFKKLSEKRAKELRRYFGKRENLYLLYGADISGTNFAFEHVLDKEVDTIYWFADFADNIKSDIIEDLTKKLEREHVPVIAHNFMGKAVREQAKVMAEKTGGETIELIPGEVEKVNEK